MDYLAELKKLPKNILDILISPFGAGINREIGKKYSLMNNQMNLIIDLTNEVYLKILNIDSLEVEISNRLKLDPKKSSSLAVEIAGKKLLIADDYFQGQITNFLNKKGAKSTDFDSLLTQQKEAINNEKIKIEPQKAEMSFNDILGDPLNDEKFLKKSKEDALVLFREDLVKILSLGPDFNEAIDDLNDELLEFIEDGNYRLQLENSLYNNNQEIVTRIKPLINNSSERGTVANWLKDFIVFNGSDNFSDITLAEYLVNSPSAKKLSAIDKKKIKKLLKIYRNLAFFPDSFSGKDKNWGIIPIEMDYSTINEKKNLGNDKNLKTEGPSKIIAKNTEIKKELIKNDSFLSKEKDEAQSNSQTETTKNSSSSAPIETSLQKELIIMLKDYPENSLEYKTIQQEIRRLNNKKS